MQNRIQSQIFRAIHCQDTDVRLPEHFGVSSDLKHITVGICGIAGVRAGINQGGLRISQERAPEEGLSKNHN